MSVVVKREDERDEKKARGAPVELCKKRYLSRETRQNTRNHEDIYC
jgi:hypothetical protein